MCLIAVSGTKSEIPKENFDNAMAHNGDGFGIMFPDGAGKLVISKGKKEAFWDTWATVPNERNFAVHFRYATKGPRDERGLHPFMVLEHERDGIDLALMHNGTMHQLGDASRSDTMQYVEERLTPILRACPALITMREFRAMLANDIGGGKFCLMNGAGDVYLVNEHSGHWNKDGSVWYSNKYSLEPPRPKVENNYMGWSYDPYANGGQGDWINGRNSTVTALPHQKTWAERKAERKAARKSKALTITAPVATTAIVSVPTAAQPALLLRDGYVVHADGTVEGAYSTRGDAMTDWRWKTWNLKQCSETELFQMVYDEPHKAMAVAKELLGGGCVIPDDIALLTDIILEAVK